MAGVILADKEPGNSRQRLGTSGLALHYANLINQIDNIVSEALSFFTNHMVIIGHLVFLYWDEFD